MDKELPGVTNYYIPVYPPLKNGNGDGNDENDDNVDDYGGEEKPVMIWWFFDSQGGFSKDGREPQFVDDKVVQWFRNENDRLQSKWGQLPSLVFVHIPTYE